MRKFKDYNQKLDTKLADCKKYCKCGHSVIIPKTMKKEYKICGWCGGRIYVNDEKQRIHNLQCEREEFRMEMRHILSRI